MRPILLLLLVAMIASAVWLSFGRVEARADSVEGVGATRVVPVQVPDSPALHSGDDVSRSRAEAALAELIAAHARGGAAQIRADEADAQLREAQVPRTLDALRVRFTDAYIALQASGVSKEAALATLAELERAALAEPTSKAR